LSIPGYEFFGKENSRKVTEFKKWCADLIAMYGKKPFEKNEKRKKGEIIS
jgi:hypothetical protein